MSSEENVLVCAENIQSKGIWFDTNFTKEPFNVFIMQLVLINLVGSVFYIILRFLKQTKFVSQALAGVCVGYGLGQWRKQSGLFPEEEIIVIRIAASIGMLYFIFIIGVKMDVTMLRKMTNKGAIIGGVSFGAPCLAIFLLLWKYKLTGLKIDGFVTPPLYYLFAAGLSVTRFPNVAYAFEELDLLTSDLGQLVMSSAMVSEVITWVTIVIGIQSRAASYNVTPWPVLSVLGLLGFTALVIRPTMVWIVKTTPTGQPVRTSMIVAILAGVMAMAFMGELLGNNHLGVFAMGIVVPNGPPLASELVAKTEVVIRDVFMPLFYLSMGYNVGLSHVFGDRGPLAQQDLEELTSAVMLVVIGCTVKFVAVFLASMFCKLRMRYSVLLGLMMNIKGPFDMWLFTRWVNSNDLKRPTYASLMLAQIAVTAVVTPIIVKLYNIYVRIHQPGAKIRSIQLNPSWIDLRILFCVHEEENVPGLITLLQASHTSAARLYPYVVHLNELVGRAAPLISPARKQPEIVLLSEKTDHIERAFYNHIKKTNGLVMMGMFNVIAPYRTMHENICKLALDESITLIIVPFNKYHEDENEVAAIRHLNCNVQDNAACTVGILMDNGLGQCLTRYHSFSCMIAVIFIHGADDREALALGGRMAGHKRVKLTVLRLVVQIRSDDEDGNKEKLLDDSFIEDFKSNNSQNSNIQYCEAVAGNIQQALDGIRALGSGYDLVIVGRERKASESIFDELVVEWSEYPELGMIGDFVSSSDFNGGNTSALVIQHSRETEDSVRLLKSPSAREEEYTLRRNSNTLSVDHQSA